MKLTQEQQKKVEQNMRLVGKVIKDKSSWYKPAWYLFI